MDEFPFENVFALVSQMRAELIPQAMQELFRRRASHGGTPPWLAEVAAGLDRVTSELTTDAEVRTWFHRRASLRQWRVVDEGFGRLMMTLGKPDPTDRAAKLLAVELVSCPTLANTVRLAMRGPI